MISDSRTQRIDLRTPGNDVPTYVCVFEKKYFVGLIVQIIKVIVLLDLESRHVLKLYGGFF